MEENQNYGRPIPEVQPEEILTETGQGQQRRAGEKIGRGRQTGRRQEKVGGRWCCRSWHKNPDGQITPQNDTAVKLCQSQVWKKDGQYIRIVRLERLEVEYKSLDSLASMAGTKTITSKKDFCRLLKGAHLLSARKKSPKAE